MYCLLIPAFVCVVSFSVIALIPLFAGINGDNKMINTLIIDTATKSLNDIFKNVDDVYKTVEASMEGETLFGVDGIINTPDSEGYVEIIGAMEKSMVSHSFIEFTY